MATGAFPVAAISLLGSHWSRPRNPPVNFPGVSEACNEGVFWSLFYVLIVHVGRRGSS